MGYMDMVHIDMALLKIYLVLGRGGSRQWLFFIYGYFTAQICITVVLYRT